MIHVGNICPYFLTNVVMFDLMWVNSPYMENMGFDDDDDDDDDDDFNWSLLFHGNSYATGFHGLISLRLQLRVRW